jgi:hypothetical protein
MPRLGRFTAIAPVAAIIACGSSSSSPPPSTCSGVVNAFANISSKTASCHAVIVFSIGQSFPSSGGYSANDCNADLANCSSADRAAIDMFVNCVNALPELPAGCSQAEISAFQEGYNACTRW